MNSKIDFLKINNIIKAENTLWLQGPGGNTSVKVDNNLYVKASGTNLKNINTIEQFALLDRNLFLNSVQLKFNNLSEVEYKNAIEEANLKENLKPSMESGFHVFLENKFICHFHSLLAICLAELSISIQFNEFKTWFDKTWSNRLLSPTFVEPSLPGLNLTKIILKSKNSSIYFLRNHGVILAFDDPNFIDVYKDFEWDAFKNFFPDQYHYLNELKNLDVFQILLKDRTLISSEIKFYFPDMAILFPRISKNLTNHSNNIYSYVLDLEHVDKVDIDALENWVASSILQKILPTLSVLPKDFCENVSILPTELARKKLMEQKK